MRLCVEKENNETCILFFFLKWRWRVFSDGVEDMTAHWWELRLQYQGIIPPVPRSERNFDPAAKYHIPADNPYAK